MAPVAYARRPLSEASSSPMAASSTAHSSPMSRPGISALVCVQIAPGPCTWVIVPR